MDAFFASSNKTLYVFNPAGFSEGIRAGHFAVKWQPGSISALVVGIVGPVDVQVIKDLIDWLRKKPPLKIGDTVYTKLANKFTVHGGLAGCQTRTETKADKMAYLPFDYLAGSGQISGSETLTYVQRMYFFDTHDCSAGFHSSTDFGPPMFVLSAGVWPNP